MLLMWIGCKLCETMSKVHWLLRRALDRSVFGARDVEEVVDLQGM